MKETLIIYRDWWEAIKSLPTELQPDAFNAICEYAFEGKQPTDPMISAVTALMRSAIDRDKAKWEEVRKKRSEAGKRGLAKRWGKQKSNTEIEIANDSKNSNCYQMQEPQPEASDTSKLEKEFEEFRKLYPGNKRGFAIEFAGFKKKYPKKWREIIPLLVPAVERLLAYHKAANEAKSRGANIFVPNFAYLATWLNNARWEDEYPAIDEPPKTPSKATPSNEAPDYSDTDFGGMQY